MTAHLAEIWRHPIKGHGREPLGAVPLAPGATLPWDRAWAVAHEAAKLEPGAWAPCQNFARGAKAPALMAISAAFDEGAGRIHLRHPDLPDIAFAPDDPEDAARFIAWAAPLNPPDIMFAFVWPALFALMLAGALMVLSEAGSFKRASAEIGLYFTMLAANVCWSLFFFGFRDPAIALGVLIALWLLIATMMLRFAVHSLRAALLQMPYLLWVTFAAYLNFYVWAFNAP